VKIRFLVPIPSHASGASADGFTIEAGQVGEFSNPVVAQQFIDIGVQVRLRVSMRGLFEGAWSPRRGDVVTVPNLRTAARYMHNGLAQPVWESQLGEPYEPWKGSKK
jgi:hypothetical protein